jgi:hypothetical protein
MTMSSKKNLQLLVAIENWDVPQMEQLLKDGANPNVKDDEETTGIALVLNAYNTMYPKPNNLLKVLDLFFRYGADPSAECFGSSALNLALNRSLPDVALLCLAKGASLEYSYASGSYLHLAAEKRYTPVVRMLLQKGADPNLIDHECYTPLLKLVDPHANYDHARYSDGSKILPIVKELVEHGANVNAIDYRGNTILHFSRRDIEDFDKVIHYLTVKKGMPLNKTNYFHKTPLDIYVSDNNFAATKALLKSAKELGVQLNCETTNPNENTPLAQAIINGNESMVRLLIKYGINA